MGFTEGLPYTQSPGSDIWEFPQKTFEGSLGNRIFLMLQNTVLYK